MSRWNAQPVEEMKPREVSLIQVFKREDGRDQKIDLTYWSDRPELAQTLAGTFWIEMQGYAPKSRNNIADNLKLLKYFLDYKRGLGLEITSASEFTQDLLGDLARWLLNVRNLKLNTAHNKYCSIGAFLASARRYFPESFRPDFTIPENCFPGSKLVSIQAKSLSREAFGEILKAASEDCARVEEAYLSGEFSNAFADIVPFMIMIGSLTAMNVQSLCEMRRNCLEPHPLDENAYYLTWTKRRSAAGKQQQLHFEKRNGVIALIRFVLRYTEPLVACAAEQDRDKLFLYRGVSFNGADLGALVAEGSKLNLQIDKFIQRHRLPFFRLIQLRPTAGTMLYLETGGNIKKVQTFLGHKYLETANSYIAKETVRPYHNKIIRTAQAKMVKCVTVIPKEAQVAVEELHDMLPEEHRLKVADGTFSTGFSRCSDPYNSPQEGQTKGKCCTLFNACFTCPNAIFFLEDLPYVINIRNHFESLRKSMTVKDWEETYGINVYIIERDIIAAFTDEQVEAAEAKAAKIEEKISVLMEAKFLK